MPLTPEQIEIIKSTVPILEQGGETLTRHFYDKMLAENESVRPFFNKTHQKSGAQPKALARSLLMYAKHIDDLEALAGLVERIVQKHCSLIVEPQHYPIVGKYLINAMGEVLGKDVATPAVVEAWTLAYNDLAQLLIEAEKLVYDSNAVAYGGWRGYRQFRIAQKSPETREIASFFLRPVDDLPILKPEPGQFLGFRFPMESGDIYARQYSISHLVDEESNKPFYRVTVKRLAGGIISKYWHDKLKVGDVVDVTPPCGDMVLDEHEANKKLVLIGAGIGITPLIPMAEAATAIGRDVTFVQSERDLMHQPFAKFFLDMNNNHKNFHYRGYISNRVPEEDDAPDDGGYHKHLVMPPKSVHGRLTKELLHTTMADIKGPADVYICGPHAFMHEHRRNLESFGNKDHVVHYEYFGPTVE